MIFLIYGILMSFLRNSKRLADLENEWMINTGKRGRGRLGVWDGRVHAHCCFFKIDITGTCCTAQGTLLSVFCINLNRKNLEKKRYTYN